MPPRRRLIAIYNDVTHLRSHTFYGEKTVIMALRNVKAIQENTFVRLNVIQNYLMTPLKMSQTQPCKNMIALNVITIPPTCVDCNSRNLQAVIYGISFTALLDLQHGYDFPGFSIIVHTSYLKMSTASTICENSEFCTSIFLENLFDSIFPTKITKLGNIKRQNYLPAAKSNIKLCREGTPKLLRTSQNVYSVCLQIQNQDSTNFS
ncbi:hypothetical protein Bhyg_14926 [Pseudolycoriella hygida]|uniref:Uncharacterized protein n=1 Tax=Pseudolycoriella hygida TaxID=35572 RepID=A0A9Q0RXX2_9DIPT|nr:hypothetical protein Bhyg_14926 [Pseudolycoriella hygida]